MGKDDIPEKTDRGVGRAPPLSSRQEVGTNTRDTFLWSLRRLKVDVIVSSRTSGEHVFDKRARRADDETVPNDHAVHGLLRLQVV